MLLCQYLFPNVNFIVQLATCGYVVKTLYLVERLFYNTGIPCTVKVVAGH